MFLKAKYFPHSSFMEVEVCLNAAYMWRSTCAARDVIKHGSRWQTGDGSSVKAWGDRWLPSPSMFQIFTPKPEGCSLSLMWDFITLDANWDLNLLCSLLSIE